MAHNPHSIAYAFFDTAIGLCAIAWSTMGIRWLQLPEAGKADARRRLRARFEALDERKPPAAVRRAIREVTRHLEGKPARLAEIAVDDSELTPFTRKVHRALRKTRPGQTLSYGELAARAGSPKAARAVGRAMATNPFPVIVPCHRVLAAGGKPGGFSAHGGVITKSKLLALEGYQLDVEPLFAGSRQLPFDAAKARRQLRGSDHELAQLMRRVGRFGLKLKAPRSTFAALAEAIVYQQLTTKAAATIFGRVAIALATNAASNVAPRRAFRPRDVQAASDAQLRAAGLSRAKTAALRDLADKTLAGAIPSLAALRQRDDEAIIETLTSVRGIGRWTVEMLLIFQLGRPDVLPVGDYGLRKGLGRMLSLTEVPSPAEVAARGERWRPYRTVASWYLWRALEL